MSSLTYVSAMTKDERSNTARVINAITTFVQIGLIVVALILVVRDLSSVKGASLKFAILALALLMPELYVILHWISTSSMGLGFWTGAPLSQGKSFFEPFTPASSMMGPKMMPSTFDSMSSGLSSSDASSFM